jgi:cytochrome c2
MLQKAFSGSLILILGFTAASAHATGNPQNGEQIFKRRCQACHALEPSKNGVGPTLYGIFGRKAGTVPGYAYSPAVTNSRVVWNEDTLKRYLGDPHKLIPGDKMIFAGIKSDSELDDLTAYLKQAQSNSHSLRSGSGDASPTP